MPRGRSRVILSGIITADPRDTEMWLYLERGERPAEAQWAAATVLREAYFWFARWSAGVAVALWSLAVLLALFRGEPG